MWLGVYSSEDKAVCDMPVMCSLEEEKSRRENHAWVFCEINLTGFKHFDAKGFSRH